MEKYQEYIIILHILSVVCFVAPFVVYFVRRILEKILQKKYKRSTMSRMLIFSGFLLASIYCLRFAVGYHATVTGAEDALVLKEELFNSLVHALQTFSMDEDYTRYLLDGKKIIGAIFEDKPFWVTTYGVYSSVLNVIAPIVGGAIVFEMIASVFPRIRFWLYRMAVWKEKYYFSELNEESLALARSVCNIKMCALKRPVIIFTDVYFDKEEEKSSEIFLEAKQLGAICIRDDLSHVRKNLFGRRKFFLIDIAEAGNLETLANLATPSNGKFLKKSEIYLLTSNDAYVQVEESVCKKLRSDMGFSEQELPNFVPVQNYRNLVSNLLVDIPLYEPLIGKKRDSEGNRTLTVTILGTGYIGTEMFLSTYWLGQMLDCRLVINVISQEEEKEFWSKLDYINPEIRHTTMKNHPILRINRKGDMADVYCEVNYRQCDIKSSDFIKQMTDKSKNILDTDYFLVSLGSDADNISAANTVRRYVGQHHLEENNGRRAVIAYVVYDAELANTLNQKKFFSCGNNSADIYMQAIGSLDEVYSVRNVFMSEYDPFADKAYDAYAAVQNRENRAQKHKMGKKSDYERWADLARVMHIKYKVYSMGMVSHSLFDYPDDKDGYKKETAEAYAEYKRIVRGEFEFESEQAEKEHLGLLHRMAWLEHRRWNAFTRVKGFRGTTEYSTYATPGVTGSYKQMDIKLHPCLVECDQNGIKAEISSKGVIDESTLFKSEAYDDFDLLDDLSYDLYNRKLNSYDFKQYDYPISTF